MFNMESYGFRSDEGKSLKWWLHEDKPIHPYEVAKMIKDFDRDEFMEVIQSAASHSPRIIEDIRRVCLRHGKFDYKPPPSPLPVSRNRFSCVIEYYYISHGDGKCAMKSLQVPPRDARLLIHGVVLKDDAFRTDDNTYRWFNDPKNRDFLQSLKAGELPKEFLLKDGITRHHVMLVRTDLEHGANVPGWGRVRSLQI